MLRGFAFYQRMMTKPTYVMMSETKLLNYHFSKKRQKIIVLKRIQRITMLRNIALTIKNNPYLILARVQKSSFRVTPLFDLSSEFERNYHCTKEASLKNINYLYLRREVRLETLSRQSSDKTQALYWNRRWHINPITLLTQSSDMSSNLSLMRQHNTLYPISSITWKSWQSLCWKQQETRTWVSTTHSSSSEWESPFTKSSKTLSICGAHMTSWYNWQVPSSLNLSTDFDLSIVSTLDFLATTLREQYGQVFYPLKKSFCCACSRLPTIDLRRPLNPNNVACTKHHTSSWSMKESKLELRATATLT